MILSGFLACMKQHMENKLTQPANEDLVGAYFFQDVHKDKRKSFVNHVTPIQNRKKQTNIHILLTDMHEFFMGSYYKWCAETQFCWCAFVWQVVSSPGQLDNSRPSH